MAVESSKELITNTEPQSGDSSSVNLLFDSQFSRQIIENKEQFINDSQIEFWNIDLATEGKNSKSISDSLLMERALSIGLMKKYANNQSETGIGTIGSIEFINTSGFNVSSLGNIIVPLENQVRGNIQGSLNFDHNRDQLGTQFEIFALYGNADSSELKSLEFDSSKYFESFDFNQNEINQHLVSKISYGYSAFDGLGSIIPYSEISLINGSVRNYQLGGILKLGSNIELELIGKTNNNSVRTNSLGIKFDGKINW